MRQAALAVYLVVVGLITLTPSSPGPTRGFAYWVITALQRVIPLSWSQWEFLLNVALFVPVGLLIALLLGPRLFWIAALMALAISCSIESLQFVIPNRVPDARDLLSNGLGGLIGTLLAFGWLRLRANRRSHTHPA